MAMYGSTHAQCSPVLRQFRLRQFRVNIHIDSKSGVRSAAEMASGGDNEGCRGLADAPASFKSGVWEHFGFHVTYDDNGNKTVDRTATVCKHCAKCIQYANGNTSNI